MAKRITMQYRRKREGRTDYRKRLVLLKSNMPRLVIRKSNKGMQAQLVLYNPDGDKIIATAHARELKNFGWTGATSNIPAAYLTGMLLAQKAKKHALEHDAIIDIGLQQHHKGGRIYAVAKGAMDGGISVRIGEETLPQEKRLTGEHISETVKAQVETVKKKMK